MSRMLDVKQILYFGHILGAIVDSLLVRVTMRPGLVHPCHGTKSVPTWTRFVIV